MTDSAAELRSVSLEKIGEHRFRAINARGGTLVLGHGEDPDFTPVELLLAALAGCSALDVDFITAKRSPMEAFQALAAANKIRDQFLLKKHPKGTKGSGQVDHIAFLAQNPAEVRDRIQKHKVPMHFRSFPDAKLFQIFLKDPDDVTIEINFLGEVIDAREWQGKGSASAMTLDRSAGRRTSIRKQN